MSGVWEHDIDRFSDDWLILWGEENEAQIEFWANPLTNLQDVISLQDARIVACSEVNGQGDNAEACPKWWCVAL